MSGWYYMSQGRPRAGPVDLDELKFKAAFGEIGPNDLVWHEGLKGWVAAGTITHLGEQMRARGLPLPHVDVQPGAPLPSPALASPPSLPVRRGPTPVAAHILSTKSSANAPEASTRIARAAREAAPLSSHVGDRSYQRIGSTFKVGEIAFYGDVVAGREAIYLVLAQRRDIAKAVGRAAGGVVGGAVTELIASRWRRHGVDGQTVVPLSALPAAVANHPTWPVRKLKPATEVVVIPRTALSDAGIVHPKWGNLLYLNVGGQRIIIEYLLFRGKRVRAVLQDMGWPVAWGDQLAQIKHELDAAQAARRGPRDWAWAAILIVLLAAALLAYSFYRAASIPKHLASEESPVEAAMPVNAPSAAETSTPGETSPHLVAFEGDIDALKTLKERGVDFSARDKHGATVLHAAASSKARSAELLEAVGPKDVNERNVYGRTPLLIAVGNDQSKMLEVVQWLMSNGADATARDNSNSTALDLLRMKEREGLPEMAYDYRMVRKLLTAAGARQTEEPDLLRSSRSRE